jgi:hypothetical protein
MQDNIKYSVYFCATFIIFAALVVYFDKRDPIIVTDKPAVAKIPLTGIIRNTLKTKLDEGSLSTVRLNIDEVTKPATVKNVVGLRLFLNKADASSEKDPHYVADIAFQPVDQPQSFTIDIKPTLVKLHENKLFKPQKPLRLIAVANPLDPKQPMENVEITIGKLSIVVP